MKMRRMTAIVLTLMMIGSLTACGGDKKEKSQNTSPQTESETESAAAKTEAPEETEPAEPTVEQVLDTYYYKATLDLPASEAGDGSLQSEYVPEESVQRGASDCGVANDKAAIELEYSSYTFQTNSDYQKKYGEKDPNFENYVEYMLDSSLQNVFTTGIEETKVGEYEALKYIYNGVNYVLNVEGLPAQFTIAVIPLTEDEDPEELAEDPEINTIINSIKVEALNN